MLPEYLLGVSAPVVQLPLAPPAVDAVVNPLPQVQAGADRPETGDTEP